MRVVVFDSTLSEGTRAHRVSFSAEDKLSIATRLDEFGFDYIDGGRPDTERDREFFVRARDIDLKHARLVASGPVRAASNSVDNDPHVKALFEAAAPVVCLAGESWDRHVYRALRSTAADHLRAIADSVHFFKDRGREVIYNAENFFEAYANSPEFAIQTSHTAESAGADVICLCDSTGGALTSNVKQVCELVRHLINGSLGIRAYNDGELAVANTLAAVEAGFDHAQGCIDGYGARAGCANLCSVLPNLELKESHHTIGRTKLEHLGALARYVADLANLPVPEYQPFVGVPPLNIVDRLAKHRLASNLSDIAHRELTEQIRYREQEGYDLDAADGTLELLIRQALTPDNRLFDVLSYDVTTKSSAAGTCASANVCLAANGAVLAGAAEAPGPINALEQALRRCLATMYPSVGSVQLTDFKVRILDPHRGVAGKARVLMEWSDGRHRWVTEGVSDNVIAASWNAMLDAIRLEMMRWGEIDGNSFGEVRDYSWAV